MPMLRTPLESMTENIDAASGGAHALPGRWSGAPRVKELLTLLLMGTGGCILGDTASPDDQPLPRYSATSCMDIEELPSPDEDIESIMWKLPTPERYGKFLKKHVQYDSTKNPMAVYHISPQEFQDGGFRGVCSNMARFFCECMERHGYTTYYVNLLPQNILRTRPSTSHQISFIRTGENTFWICDNLECFPWNGPIENYWTKQHPHMRLAPWGIARYRRPKENILSRSLIQLRRLETIEICPLPEPPAVGNKEIALAVQ